MGFSSQSGAIVVANQPVAGTPVNKAGMEADGLGLRLTSGSLAGNRELLVPDPEIGGGRDTSDGYLGAVSFSGDYEAYVRFKTIAFFLHHCLGASTSAAASGDSAVFEHTIVPVDSGTLPFLSVYERISNNLERFLYTDAVVNTLHIEAEANGFLTGTFGLLAKSVTPDAVAVDPSGVMDNTSMAVGTNIVLKYDGVTVPAKSFSLDVNNNIEDDDFRLGSFFLNDLTAKQREVTASMTVRHNDASIMRQALFGTAAATQIGGLTTKKPLTIEISSYENVAGSVANTKYSLEIELPKVIFAPFAFEPSGDDVLESDVEMTAVRPSLATPVMRAVVANEWETAFKPEA